MGAICKNHQHQNHLSNIHPTTTISLSIHRQQPVLTSTIKCYFVNAPQELNNCSGKHAQLIHTLRYTHNLLQDQKKPPPPPPPPATTTPIHQLVLLCDFQCAMEWWSRFSDHGGFVFYTIGAIANVIWLPPQSTASSRYCAGGKLVMVWVFSVIRPVCSVRHNLYLTVGKTVTDGQ